MKNERARKQSWSLWLVIMASVSFLHSSEAATGDENWDESFGVPGTDGPIRATILCGGELFVAGRFSESGGVSATNIARWDGTNWWPLQAGLSSPDFPTVFSLAVVTGVVYAGGVFSQAGDVPVNNIAGWNGSDWFPLGTGVNSIVRAMASDGTNLYVAGTFTQAGGINATNIAKWDGTNWSALGGGISGEAVDSVAVGGGYVYVAGRFIVGGDIGATNIARWDGTNWSALGKGLRSTTGDGGGSAVVRALLTKGNELYAGGGFRLAGEVGATTNIARWDGADWWPLGGGIDASGEVHVLAFSGDALYVGGFFNLAGSVPAKNIAKWDGTSWNSLGSGTSDSPGAGSVRALAANGIDLFVGGFFTSAGGKPSSRIARWHIPHALNAERVGNQLRLSWPATGTNFLLEACGQLVGTNWTEVPQPPALVDDQLVITNELDGDSRFYRLRKK